MNRGWLDKMNLSQTKQPDYILLATIFLLLTIGIIMVFSSSYIMAYKWYGNSFYFFTRQAAYSVIAIVVFFIALRIDYHIWRKFAIPILLLSIFLLTMLYLPGLARYIRGAKRWLTIGPFSFQPSEMAKIALILYIADCLTRKKAKDISSFVWGILPVFIITVFIFLLVFGQPDFSTAIVIMGCSFIMLFIGGSKITQLFALIILLVPPALILALGKDYRRVRLLSFLNPWGDPLNSGFHIIQSLLALGSGGLFGVGIAESRQKFFYLPDQHTDFIFSIIGEELGFIGALVIIILFLVFLWRGFLISLKSRDTFGLLLAAGITSLIVFQALVNISVVTKLIPTTGISLPFISYGGSSLIANMFCCGILLNISKNTVEKNGAS
jgi:cell division protein FtsW